MEALQKGLSDLQDLFEHVLHTFKVCALCFIQVYIRVHVHIHGVIVVPLTQPRVHNEIALFGLDHFVFLSRSSRAVSITLDNTNSY